MIPGQQPCCISLTFLQCVFFQMTPQSAGIRGCLITLVAFEAVSVMGDRIGGGRCATGDTRPTTLLHFFDFSPV